MLKILLPKKFKPPALILKKDVWNNSHLFISTFRHTHFLSFLGWIHLPNHEFELLPSKMFSICVPCKHYMLCTSLHISVHLMIVRFPGHRNMCDTWPFWFAWIRTLVRFWNATILQRSASHPLICLFVCLVLCFIPFWPQYLHITSSISCSINPHQPVVNSFITDIQLSFS